tara:strand:- start:1417 stop:1956 length:540 start_codon:yes stop_codon:yes gene_type:complete
MWMKSGRMKTFLFLLLFFSCSSVPLSRTELGDEKKQDISQQLKPFISDGCSLWPEGTAQDRSLWLECCVFHDLKYWRGGTQGEKNLADKEFKQCIAEKGYTQLASLMEFGVEVGGSPRYATSFKWGYGWTYDRGYVPLTPKEKKYLRTLAPKSGEDLSSYVDKKAIDSQIKKIPKIILP